MSDRHFLLHLYFKILFGPIKKVGAERFLLFSPFYIVHTVLTALLGNITSILSLIINNQSTKLWHTSRKKHYLLSTLHNLMHKQVHGPCYGTPVTV